MTSGSAAAGVIVVTGGAGAGIGQAISRSVAEQGWSTVVADRDLEAAAALARELEREGLVARAAHVDVSDERSVELLFAETVAPLGPVRGLVNSAGVGLVKPLAEVSSSEWDLLHGVDLRGAYLCIRATLPLLVAAGGGSIVNIGSVQAAGPHLGYAAYAAAKAGLIGLTRGVAADYGSAGVRCSVIHPGLVDSIQNREIFSAWGDPQEWIDAYVQTRQMIPRAIAPSEIGAVAAFLLSEASASITAAEITVDAGSSRMAFDNTEGRS